MRSTASYKGHPIHPALIPFPTAFVIGAFAFDAIARLADEAVLAATAGHLAAAGVVTGVIAALPGAVDYLYTVPPRSSGRTRATRHALTNLAGLALIAAAWLVRGPAGTLPGAGVLALELGAAALIAAGGWMGGVLVSRNQISVDHRYADAGTWKEASIPRGAGPVAGEDELAVNQMKLLRAGDRRLVLGRDDRGYVAFDDRCPHRGGSLAGGAMICGTVQCPWHGSQFDVRTGAVKAGPATKAIGTLSVEVTGGTARLVS